MLGDPHRFASRHFPVTDDKHVLRNDCAGFSNGFTQCSPGPWQPIVSAGKGILSAGTFSDKINFMIQPLGVCMMDGTMLSDF